MLIHDWVIKKNFRFDEKFYLHLISPKIQKSNKHDDFGI